ncbi:MAG TPA: NUDIX domain-containing protein [Candidatus Andersenbacteria bacterium]|nr:NUDIX domain-containing protein [Candidatus Andersenbacteria bacterium]
MTQPLLALLEHYKPFDEMEAAHLEQFRQFLNDSSNPYDRSNLVGHVVAEAWIVNPARTHVVLVEHGLNKVWIVPGGHCDGNPDVQAGAIRETEEETGLTNLKPLLHGRLFDINVGTVPTRKKQWGIEPEHLHFDTCFAFEAPDNAPLKISDESDDLAWVAIADMQKLPSIHGHYRRQLKTLAGMLR